MAKSHHCARKIICVSMALVLSTAVQAAEDRTAKTITVTELNRLIGGPTLVSLHLKNVPPQRVFEEIARQTNSSIDTAMFGYQTTRKFAPMSIDVDRKPFWPLLFSLAEKLKISVYPTVDTRIILQDGAHNGLYFGPVTDSGAVLICVQSSSSAVGFDYANPQKLEADRWLHFNLVIDPKLRLLDISPPFQIETAADEKGRTLFETRSRASSQGVPFGLNTRVDFNATGQPVASDRLVKLSGTAKILVATKVERWAVSDVLKVKNVVKNVRRTAGNSQYVLRDVVQTDHNYEVHLSLSRREFDLQNVNPRNGDFQYRVQLYDAQNRQLLRRENGARVLADPARKDGERIFLTVPFERGPKDWKLRRGAPFKLVVEIPTVRAVEVPFRFTDLPLP